MSNNKCPPNYIHQIQGFRCYIVHAVTKKPGTMIYLSVLQTKHTDYELFCSSFLALFFFVLIIVYFYTMIYYYRLPFSLRVPGPLSIRIRLNRGGCMNPDLPFLLLMKKYKMKY